MWYHYALVVLGFVFLFKSADFLVTGASAIAKRFGVSELMIGLTVVAFGTSMPEFVVNVFASIQNQTNILLGNFLGTNIANILVGLGLTAIIFPLIARRSTVWKEIPFTVIGTALLFVLINFSLGGQNNTIIRIEGILLLLFFGLFVYYVIRMAKRDRKNSKKVITMSGKKAGVLIILGMIGLYLGGKWVVDGAVFIARTFNISDFVISAILVAIGTSLPELVTSLVAVLKKNADIAISNIVGSNIFNLSLILGVCALIRPIQFKPILNIDLLILLFVTFLLFAFMFLGREKHKLERYEGVIFVIMYAAYIFYIIRRGFV